MGDLSVFAKMAAKSRETNLNVDASALSNSMNNASPVNSASIDAFGKIPVPSESALSELNSLKGIMKETNDMVRKVERQKRQILNQEETIEEQKKKIQKIRLDVRRTVKKQSVNKRFTSEMLPIDIRIDSLRARLNEALSRDKHLREEVNRLRATQVDHIHLVGDHLKKQNAVKTAIEETKVSIKQSKKTEQSIRNELVTNTSATEQELKALKNEWKQLNSFVEAKSEKVKQRRWNEKKRLEEEKEQEEKERVEEARRQLLQMNPFSRSKPNNKQVDAKKRSSVAPVILNGKLTVDEEKHLKSNITKSRWKIASGQVAATTLEEKAKGLDEGFKLLREKTGIEAPSKMADLFLTREEENFRLFQHVNLISQNIEEIEFSMQTEQEEQSKIKTMEDEADHGTSILQSLEDRLVTLEVTTDKYEVVGASSTAIIDAVKQNVASLFIRIGCDTSLIEALITHHIPLQDELEEEEVLTPKKGKYGSMRTRRSSSSRAETLRIQQAKKSWDITEKNILKFMGIIEQRVSELITLHSMQYHHRKKGLDMKKVKLQVKNLPSTDDADDWSDNDEDDPAEDRPLSYKELLLKVSTQT